MKWFRQTQQHAPPGSDERKNNGQSLVEFALGVPLILLLLLGTLDFGQVFFEYIQLRNAVREGASYGARNPLDDTQIRTIVREHAGISGEGSKISGLGNSAISITRNAGCCTVGDPATITVSATKDYKPIITGFFQRFGLGTVTLAASSKAKVMT